MASLNQYDIAGAAMQGFQQGREIRNRNQLNQLAAQAYSTAPEGQNALLGQIAQISPQAAAAQQQQFQQGEDRTSSQLRGLVQYVNKARATNDPRQVNAALASAGPFIQRLTGKAPPTEWTPDMDAGWAQLEAQVAMQGGASGPSRVQSRFVGEDGQVYAMMADSPVPVPTGIKADRQMWFRDHPGMPPELVGKDGVVMPVGQPAQVSAPGSQGAPVANGQQFVDESLALANQMIAAGIPEQQVDAFLQTRMNQGGGNQLQTTQAVVPMARARPSEGQIAAEQAAARAGVDLQYAPAMRAIQTQGALEQARGEAQIQTDSTIQRGEAKLQAERARNLPQLQEQRRVLTDALQGLGTKYRTGPINTVIPDALQSADNQVFMTVVNNAVLDAASKLTGVISDKDMEFLRRATVNLDSREDANREILRRQLRIIDEGIQKAQQAGGSTQRRAPQPGTVQDGYRFRGGNPADPNSWERI